MSASGGVRAGAGLLQPTRKVRLDESTTLIYGNELWTTPVSHITKYEAHLKDTQRVLAYRNAIMRLNADFIKGKIVMDVSKKNGHYAGFAVRAGAKKCYIIESCLEEAKHTQDVLNLNGYQDKCVVIQCQSIADLELDEGDECVDVLIHESVGECLFVMSGIKEVLDARDKFLRKKGGLILPNETSLYMAGIENEELRQHAIDFWCRPIQGLNFENLREMALSEPEIGFVTPETVVTEEAFLARFNLYTAKASSLFVDVPFFVEPSRSCNITGFVAFFKMDFGRFPKVKGETKTGLSTSPLAAVTGWEHCVFPIDKVIPIQAAGEYVHGRFKLYATNQDMATNFAAQLEVVYTRKNMRLHEKRFYSFYNTTEEW